VRILIVDDEAVFLDAIRRALQRMEPDWEIDCLTSPDQAATVAFSGSYDVVVVDWNLGHPTITGLTICEDLCGRSCGSAVVLLTARDHPDDRIAAAAAGADDHIVKRLGLREIHARIKVAGARGPTSARVFQCGALRMDMHRQQLTLSGEPVELTKHQWLLMSRLARSPSAPVGAAELCRTAGIEPGDEYKNLRNEVHRLRSRLDEHRPGAGAILLHVRRFGYALRPATDMAKTRRSERMHDSGRLLQKSRK
jgi:DNA-binding response OmpR family regulator